MKKSSLILICIAILSYLPQILPACTWSEWNSSPVLCLWHNNNCTIHESRSCNCSDVSKCGSLTDSRRALQSKCDSRDECPHSMKHSGWEVTGDWTGPCPTKKRKLIRKCEFHALDNDAGNSIECTKEEEKYEEGMHCTALELGFMIGIPIIICVITFAVGMALLIVYYCKTRSSLATPDPDRDKVEYRHQEVEVPRASNTYSMNDPAASTENETEYETPITVQTIPSTSKRESVASSSSNAPRKSQISISSNLTETPTNNPIKVEIAPPKPPIVSPNSLSNSLLRLRPVVPSKDRAPPPKNEPIAEGPLSMDSIYNIPEPNFHSSVYMNLDDTDSKT